MFVWISIGVLIGVILGGSVVAIVFALDKNVVKVKDDELVIDKDYYEIMRGALGRKGHLMVLRELASRGKIKASEVVDPEDDEEEYD